MNWPERETLLAAWRSFRSAVFDLDRLRQLFTYNILLKLLSVAIAFSLWLFVNFGERDTEESFKAALELRNMPAHLMITSPRVDFIDLRLSGPRTLLGRIDRSRLSIPLDLGGVRPGPAVFRVGAEALNLPRGVKILRITPAQVTLELERVAHKSVPVQLRFVGKLPADMQIGETKVSPETVQVTGPASDVEDVHAAYTEALDVSSVSPGTIERELPLDVTGDYLSFSATRVAAQVRIEEVSVTRDLRRVEVTVRDDEGRYEVVPDHVRVIVRGPKHVVSNLELEHGAVYIDLQNDQEPRSGFVKPSIELPTGVELVSVEPEKVHLIVRKGKRRGAGRR